MINFRIIIHNFVEFVNTQAELSQDRIEEKCRLKLNRHFLHLDQCAKNLCSERESTTDNTLPVTLEAIANLDTHPKPEEVNGVDLKVLYQMLANLCAGYPIEELENGPTKEFLKQCYTVRHQELCSLDFPLNQSCSFVAGIDGQCFGNGCKNIPRSANGARQTNPARLLVALQQ